MLDSLIYGNIRYNDFFFFSSRRRHTRWNCDWSSDVCSSDLCDRLKPEFPDISISKIRYLEGEGLVTPQRTRGGYRLFGEDELERLETILRLQRDEFLP